MLWEILPGTSLLWRAVCKLVKPKWYTKFGSTNHPPSGYKFYSSLNMLMLIRYSGTQWEASISFELTLIKSYGPKLEIQRHTTHTTNSKRESMVLFWVSSLKIFEFLFIFFKIYLFIFRERGRDGEREGESYQCVVASRAPHTGDLACNPGMCPYTGNRTGDPLVHSPHSIHWATPARAKSLNF